MMRNKYAALLDLDGTLVDSLYIYHVAVNHVLAKFGISCTYEEMFALAGSSGVELYTHFLKKSGKYDPSKDDEMYDIFNKDVYEMLDDVQFPEESTNTILLLKRSGHKVAICTGASRRYVDTVLPEAVINAVDSIVTCDDVVSGKPHPETFLTAADNIGTHPSNCIVVGDSLNDLVGARSAGMTFILVRNDHNTDIKEGYIMEINSIDGFIEEFIE